MRWPAAKAGFPQFGDRPRPCGSKPRASGWALRVESPAVASFRCNSPRHTRGTFLMAHDMEGLLRRDRPERSPVEVFDTEGPELAPRRPFAGDDEVPNSLAPSAQAEEDELARDELAAVEAESKPATDPPRLRREANFSRDLVDTY